MMRKSIALYIFLFTYLSVACFSYHPDHVDTKYICSFSYKQPGIFDSVYSLSPSVLFDQGVSRLSNISIRTGYLFKNISWLELGLYYRYVDQIDINNKWVAENRVEFEFTPKILISFLNADELSEAMRSAASGLAGGAEFNRDDLVKELSDDDMFTATGKKALRFIMLDMRAEIEYWNLDLVDTSKVNPVLKLRPGTSWLYDFGTVYLADEALYSIKYNEWFSNWIRLGVIRPFFDMKLDTFYVYESLRPIPTMPEWGHANIFGTSFSYTIK